MSGKRSRRRGRGGGSKGQSRSWQHGTLRELGWLLIPLVVLGAKLGWNLLIESSSLELLWFAGEVGYHLATAEEALGFLLP